VRDIVLMKLNAVGLRGARDLMPSQVSGGMAGAWRWPARLRWTRNW
jgi:ABC-type transporter Mla maintaining outer membrane lipid asymmetry ATPase subunit MlaF